MSSLVTMIVLAATLQSTSSIAQPAPDSIAHAQALLSAIASNRRQRT
jgi:hypothetical protein